MRASTLASAYYGVRSDSKPSAAPIAVTALARQAAEPLLSRVPGEGGVGNTGAACEQVARVSARELVRSGLMMLAGGI